MLLPDGTFINAGGSGDIAVSPRPSAGLGGFFRDILGQTARDLATFGQGALYREIGVVKDEPAPVVQDQGVAEDKERRDGVSTQTVMIVGGAALALVLLVALIR